MPDSITVQQVVESAYDWACGDLTRGTWIAIGDLGRAFGDSLRDFLVRETGNDEAWLGDEAPPANSTAHWVQAIERMKEVKAQCGEVLEALENEHNSRGSRRRKR